MDCYTFKRKFFGGFLKSNIIIRLSLILITAVTLFSPQLHGIARYKAIPLNYLHDSTARKAEPCPQISFAFRKFNRSDCKKYLGRRQIINRGYQPIQIQVTNNTDRFLIFSPDNFSFPCVSFLDVVQRVHFNTSLRLVCWGIGSFFIWPLVIPFAIEAIESPRANERLELDYSNKSLGCQVIEPYGAINGLIFVPAKNFTRNFSFTLIDQQNNEKITLATINP